MNHCKFYSDYDKVQNSDILMKFEKKSTIIYKKCSELAINSVIKLHKMSLKPSHGSHHP